MERKLLSKQRIGETRTMNNGMQLTITDIAGKYHTATLFLGVWEDKTQHKKPFLYNAFKNGTIAHPSSNAIVKLGETRTMNNGMKLTITEIADKNAHGGATFTGKWEDNTQHKKPFKYSEFKRGKIAHPERLTKKVSISSKTLSRIGETRTMNNGMQLTITKIVDKYHTASLFIGVWEDNTQHKKPFLYNTFKNGTIAHPSSNAIVKLGETRTMNNGMKLTITEIADKNTHGGATFTGKWEDNTQHKKPFKYSEFKRGKITHPERLTKKVSISSKTLSRIGETRTMNNGMQLTITKIVDKYHTAPLFLGVWEDKTQHKKPFLYNAFKNGTIAHPSSNAIVKLGETRTMNNGMKLTITEIADKNAHGDATFTGKWEDNTLHKTPFKYYEFKRGTVAHPTLFTNISHGERTIRDILDKHNVTYIHDESLKTIMMKHFYYSNKQFETYVTELQAAILADGLKCPKTYIKNCRFDFTIIERNGIYGFIEYDGAQHFKFVEYFYKTFLNFLNRVNADKIKTNLSLKMNAKLLRIGYFMKDSPDYDIEEMILHFLDPKNASFYKRRFNPVLTNKQYFLLLDQEMKQLSFNSNFKKALTEYATV